MTLRIKFAKYGSLKFLSHLDTMRFFQKAVRRAEIDVAYSGGFHPHQIMSFAAPLGVGQTSEGEYFDVELNSYESLEAVFSALDAQMTDGFKILGVYPVPPTPPQTKKESVMALVRRSDYIVLRKDPQAGSEFSKYSNEEVYEALREFVKLPEIITTKTSKSGEIEVNIAPLILEYRENTDITPYSGEYENGMRFYLMLSAGLEHLRPELLMKALYDWKGWDFSPYEYQVHRLEVYTEKDNEIIPICDYHKDYKG